MERNANYYHLSYFSITTHKFRAGIIDTEGSNARVFERERFHLGCFEFF